MRDSRQIKETIRQLAHDLGFIHVGFSKADFLGEEEPRLTQWLQDGMHGEMKYMENHFDMRLDPRKLVPGAKSVISLSYNYFPKEMQREDSYRISKYAYGLDYHDVIKSKLRKLVEQIQVTIGAVEGRVFVDSAPVLEKVWAEKSGIGWVGKNGNMIHPKSGSFFFLAELICDLEVEPDGPMKDYCGTCTRCMDACPTNALETPYVVNGSKCISYATIELRDDQLPDLFKGKMKSWMYGCDICQDVCPWNRFSVPHNEPQFEPKKELLAFSKDEWLALDEVAFRELFKGSAVKRTKYSGLMRNMRFIALDENEKGANK